ncbi:hypothetical protein IEO70_03720 [Bacillus sp. AGMB 02131]|uniref:DUF4181 domain-containing protein n=1 Tax=Peribacillus faecalis TaxID=2772559 RepID=A0A927CTA0_9BACI|nr:DUF4181 domain-containing protein [Peribacillus faecalis]MBD3107463.1 hypothetical protein [Peribacillus faecalis]
MNYEQLRISGVFILLLIYIGVILFLIFRKNIPLPKKMLFSKNRKKVFIVADLLLLIIYGVTFYFLLNYAFFSAYFIVHLFSYLAILALIGLIEEYVTSKEAKGYYHRLTDLIFTTSLALLFAFIL